jgi:hypothetical protein
MRAVPLSLKISPLRRKTFPGAIALEFSICVLLSTPKGTSGNKLTGPCAGWALQAIQLSQS